MTREIKFRAWDKNRKRMYLGDELNSIHHSGIIQVVTEEYETILMPQDYILMQFTGLHDKNGKEIYEGDIADQEEVGLAIVEFGDFCIGKDDWDVEYRTACFALRWTDGSGYSGLTGERVRLKIIGNIHENPELLEVSSE